MCKTCAKDYAKNYRESLKLKKLTRKNRPPRYREHGLLYIIGTTPDNPVKIGITTGNSMKNRIAGLQTSHWLDLKIIYETGVLQNVNKIEKQIHEKFSHYRVRGEWFNIPEEEVKTLIEDLQKNFRILDTGPRK